MVMRRSGNYGIIDSSIPGSAGVPTNTRWRLCSQGLCASVLDIERHPHADDATQQTDPWQPHNFSQINTKGFTLSADYKLLAASESTLSNVRLGVSYTRLDPRFKKTMSTAVFSRYALESLRNQLSSTLSADLIEQLSFTLTTRYCERISYKNYMVMDARLAFKQKKYSIYADGANLFNIQYINIEIHHHYY